jgi:Bacterial PH domain
MIDHGEYYKATLSPRGRLLTYGVGIGVGIGVPLALALGFSVGFRNPMFLLLPLPFVGALFVVWRYRVTGYRIAGRALAVVSPMGDHLVDLSDLDTVRFPASSPPGNIFGIWRVEGFWGTRGTYWNRGWGRFRVYVTDDKNRVELLLKSGQRIIISPDDPQKFARRVSTLLAGT